MARCFWRNIRALLPTSLSSNGTTKQTKVLRDLFKALPESSANYSRLAPRFSGALLPYLPERRILSKSNKAVTLDYLRSERDKEELHAIMKGVVENGQEYCYETMDEDDFQGYFMSHDTFAVRDFESGEVLGGFYMKPNFCGRSSHVANVGFIVKRGFRSSGIGKYMATRSLYIARDMGYRSIMGNLVYANNRASLELMKKIGYQVSEGVPKAGNMKDIGLVTAYQIYFDLKILK